MPVIHISTIDAKEEFSELLNRVSLHHERIILTRRGKEIAALIPYEDFKFIQKSQSKSELEEATESFKEARREGTIALECLKEEIGLTK